MKVQHVLFSALCAFALLLPLQAQIPRTISYQGVLTDPSGNIKPDGPYNFTFRLYDASTAGTVQWGPETKDLEVSKGLFHTYLGDIEPIPPSLAFDQPYWLSIEVESEELSPRIALTSSPYSFHALRADTASYAFSTTEGGGTGDITAVIAGSGLTGGGTSGDVTLSIDPDATLVVGRIFIYQEGSTTGSVFKIDNATNGSLVMDVETFGTGQVGRFRQSNSSSGADAVSITNEGTGRALKVTAHGLTEGLDIQIKNSANIANAIRTETDGSGNAIYARYSGSGGYAGYFDGNIFTTGSLVEGSDIRWKHNITPLDNALNKVLSLRGVRFEWKREEYPDRNFKPGKQIGFIAQEIEEVLPELVMADQDDYKAVDYQKVTAVLVEAIKEQQKQIEALKAAVSAFQAQSDIALQD